MPPTGYPTTVTLSCKRGNTPNRTGSTPSKNSSSSTVSSAKSHRRRWRAPWRRTFYRSPFLQFHLRVMLHAVRVRQHPLPLDHEPRARGRMLPLTLPRQRIIRLGVHAKHLHHRVDRVLRRRSSSFAHPPVIAEIIHHDIILRLLARSFARPVRLRRRLFIDRRSTSSPHPSRARPLPTAVIFFSRVSPSRARSTSHHRSRARHRVVSPPHPSRSSAHRARRRRSRRAFSTLARGSVGRPMAVVECGRRPGPWDLGPGVGCAPESALVARACARAGPCARAFGRFHGYSTTTRDARRAACGGETRIRCVVRTLGAYCMIF